MERVRADGLTDVGRLLHQMADEIETGAISIGDRVVRCPEDLAAIIDLPVSEDGDVLVVTLRPSAPSDLRRHMAVEEELSHPGG